MVCRLRNREIFRLGDDRQRPNFGRFLCRLKFRPIRASAGVRITMDDDIFVVRDCRHGVSLTRRQPVADHVEGLSAIGWLIAHLIARPERTTIIHTSIVARMGSHSMAAILPNCGHRPQRA
jgi:hypothetical protein